MAKIGKGRGTRNKWDGKKAGMGKGRGAEKNRMGKHRDGKRSHNRQGKGTGKRGDGKKTGQENIRTGKTEMGKNWEEMKTGLQKARTREG
jgi:hypothetical protein